MSSEERYVDTPAASAITGIAAKTLRNKRHTGDGPPFVRIGAAVRYPVGKLHEWLSMRLVASTAEYPVLERRVAQAEAARAVAEGLK